ncbi:CPBP family intramembrane metalloprotease [Wenzhouxiangella sp. AB-CW3]|uniref:CPBP family intramembrane glutamic endopeptidase n=1 Tax=Wenzhouxiangella sp. AB-CW3 TaxID=2771012 RepID=UPI00168B2781|nr:type II CAAX endopeptidase family protein [Wenzhouxiangella sp. AB-CW3]QOC22919.1 CPBP family intramembrane metalloprotease [Wenzhouxiangella sp. AB-CW3]
MTDRAIESRSTGNPDHRLSWHITLIGLLIAYSPLYVIKVLEHLGASWQLIQGPQAVLVVNWLAVLVLFVFMFTVETRPLSSISFRRPNAGDIQWALIFWGVSTGFSGFLHSVHPPPPSEGMDIMLSLSLPVLVAIILTTSISEEILFRGYSVERLTELTRTPWLAIVVSMFLFVTPHIVFFGSQWLTYHGLTVALIYVLYVWRRNIWACMLMHLLGNAMILIPALGLASA